MIEDASGNLLRADAEALVNTVNCVGYMGKGIALQFKQAFPENFKAYQRACRAGEVKPGHMFVYPTGLLINPRYIINFPTKRHWRGKSRIEDIRQGLKALAEEIEHLGVKSVAVPPLGCGYGGLDWATVQPMIVSALGPLQDVRVLLYSPRGAPVAREMPVGTGRPPMTVARALLVKLIAQYLDLAYRLTLLEIQKLAYFLQEGGEPLRLRFEAGPYGPYADNLNKVLERIEGHFTRGYGDSQKPDAEIELLPGAVDEADEFLGREPASNGRLERVGALIEGFETPYGMELLSTVHWVARHSKPPATDSETAVAAVHAWSERKRSMFKPNHIGVAWRRLEQTNWLGASVETPEQASLGQKFRSLARRWRHDVEFVSSTTEMVLHDAYQQIIGMGPAVVPILLRELDREPDHWFWALRSITGADPVPPDDRGNLSAMAAAWLRWAREQGYRW